MRAHSVNSGRAPDVPPNMAMTPSMRRADTAFSLTVRQKAIMLIDGQPGTGKTTATARWAAQCSEAGIKVTYLAIPEQPTPVGLLRLIVEAVSGTPAMGRKHDMENEVKDLLSDFGGLLIVDEVQNLQRAGTQELRYLHDDTETDVAMLLSGWQADKVARARPDLDSRIGYRARFAPLVPTEVPEVISTMAPWLRIDVDVMMRVNEVYAHGVLRRWGRFIAAAHDLLGADGALTADMADDLIGIIDAQALVGAS